MTKDQSRLESLKALMSERAPLKAKRSLGEFSKMGQVNAGQLVEVLGAGQVNWVVQLLKEWKESRAAWVMHQAMQLCPMALAQEKISLSRLLFLENVKAEQGIDVLLTVLRAQLFEVMVFEQPLLPKRNLDAQMRKLQLTAEEGGCFLVLLSQRPTISFGVSTRFDTDEMQRREVHGAGAK
jgi:hypothetical protein